MRDDERLCGETAGVLGRATQRILSDHIKALGQADEIATLRARLSRAESERDALRALLEECEASRQDCIARLVDITDGRLTKTSINLAARVRAAIQETP